MDQPDDDIQSTSQALPPISTGSGVSKEAEQPAVVQEPVTHNTEHEVHNEVSEHVSVQKETVEIPAELVAIGVNHAPQDQSAVDDSLASTTTLPLTDDQIGEGLSGDPNTSYSWLATWCLRQLRYMHMHLKKIQGHFIRIKDH